MYTIKTNTQHNQESIHKEDTKKKNIFLDKHTNILIHNHEAMHKNKTCPTIESILCTNIGSTNYNELSISKFRQGIRETFVINNILVKTIKKYIPRHLHLYCDIF